MSTDVMIEDDPGARGPEPDPNPPAPTGTGAWSLSWHGVRTVAQLELRQRVRATRWIVSLVVFGLLVGGVTTLTWAVINSDAGMSDLAGPTMFGFIVFFVLFLGLLVSPTLSATAINGDRNAGTLATLQVTLLSAAEIVVGKLLAAWIASLAFLAVSVPFILWAFATGGMPPVSILVTLLLLAAILAVVCAIGLGFSALTARTAGSAVLTYVGVASLTILSLIVFGLSVPLVSGNEQVQVLEPDWGSANFDPYDEVPVEECVLTEQEMYVAHTERTWWLLAANPFVIVADAMPDAVRDEGTYYGPSDPMSAVRYGIRTARVGQTEPVDWCTQQLMAGPTETGAGLSPVWPWGLGANLLLGAGAVVLAVRRLQIPQRHLPKGTRVA